VSRVLYFDCFSGLSGDMALGALLDAGLPLADLREALGSLALGDAQVRARKVLRAGISATQFTVHQLAHDHEHGQNPSQHGQVAGEHHHDPHRSLPEILRLIDRAMLSASARERAKAMFERLAAAEATIHQTPVDQVHLHEVGAIDSIIDIVGTAFAMEWVGAERIVCSPLNVGGGMVPTAHGLLPVPAPATLALLAGAPVYGGGVQKELVTPTGALIATTYASSFGPIPAMTIERVGYGAGERDDVLTPNVLRVLVGDEPGVEARPGAVSAPNERVTIVECEIDDMNPQIFGVAMDKLYAAGALEVFYIPVQMKKNRPGTLLTVIVPPEKRAAIADVIFGETTTIGLRHHDVQRECLARECVTVDTPLGAIRFKISRRDGRVMTATPEFDDCARIATARQLSVRDVQRIAIQSYTP
jgi:uncharacterized protein (TIGR00299 family) protein